MSKKIKKTNAMRQLDQAHIAYEVNTFEYDEEDVTGQHHYQKQAEEGRAIYKTLVARTHDKEIVVLVIPIDQELDLKKCARQVGTKNLELVHVKELLGLTGYVRGGCSPLGMKKAFRTWIQEDCLQEEKIYISGGERGKQIIVNPIELVNFLACQTADLIR